MGSMLLPGGMPLVKPIAVRALGNSGANGNAAHNFYHYRNPWNCTNSRLLMIHEGPGSDWTVSLHTRDGAFLYDLFLISVRDWRLCWSKTLPQILYTWKGSSVYVYDVSTRSVVQTFTAPATIGTAGTSLNQAGTRIMWNDGVGAAAVARSYGLNSDGTIDSGSARSFTPTYPHDTTAYDIDKWRYIGQGNRLVVSSGRTSHLRSGTLQAGSTTTDIVLNATSSATDGIYVSDVIQLKNTAGEKSTVVAYNGTTKVATMSPAYASAPGTIGYIHYANCLGIFEDDGTLVAQHDGVSGEHFAHNNGKLVLNQAQSGSNIPLDIIMRNADGSGSALVVYRSGGGGSTKPTKVQNYHVTWPENDTTRFFASCFPSLASYPFSGVYTPNVSVAWDGPNAEVNADVPYDEIIEVSTTDNWATQAGVRIRYVGRTLTRDGTPFSFWDEPLAAVASDGRTLLFNSVDSGALTSYILGENLTVEMLTAAEARAKAKVADGTWINAHAEITNDGVVAVRVQRKMSVAAPVNGGWVDIDNNITV